MAATAAERLQGRTDAFQTLSVPSQAPLQRGTRLTIVPRVPGFRLDPVSVTAEWANDVQCYEFRLRAERTRMGQATNGVVQILEGPLLRGELPIAVVVLDAHLPAPGADRFTTARVAGYRNTFPSYSRKGEPIVRAFEAVVEASGDRYLRDVRTLRAGQEWAPALLEYIDQADVFQLFWSRGAPSPARSSASGGMH